MKRKTRAVLYILLILISLFTRLSICAADIKKENDSSKHTKQAFVVSTSINLDLVEHRKIDYSNRHVTKTDTGEAVVSAETYIIIIFALYFILNNPPPYVDKILCSISTIYFNVGKYKKLVNTF